MGCYDICEYCGGHIDHGEKCDCLREKERERQERYNFLAVGNGGQLYIRSMANEQNVRRAI